MLLPRLSSGGRLCLGPAAAFWPRALCQIVPGLAAVVLMSVAVNGRVAGVEPQTALATGGLSPDGQYEVRLQKTDEPTPSNYVTVIRDRTTGRVLGELTTGGRFSYEEALHIVRSLWHPNAPVVAVVDAGTQHSRELHVFEVRRGEVRSVPLPDYRQNALGRVDATSIFQTSVTSADSWDGDALNCTLVFDTERAHTGAVAERGPTFRVPFILRLRAGTTRPVALALAAMGRPIRNSQ